MIKKKKRNLDPDPSTTTTQNKWVRPILEKISFTLDLRLVMMKMAYRRLNTHTKNSFVLWVFWRRKMGALFCPERLFLFMLYPCLIKGRRLRSHVGCYMITGAKKRFQPPMGFKGFDRENAKAKFLLI